MKKRIPPKRWFNRDYWKTAEPVLVRKDIDNGADVNARNEIGQSPLHFAAEHSRTRGVIEALINAGAEIDARNNINWTPLHEAARTGNIIAVQVLLERGALVTATTKRNTTPLHFACGVDGHANVVKALLESGANPEAVNNDGKTPEKIAGMCIPRNNAALHAIAEFMPRWEERKAAAKDRGDAPFGYQYMGAK